MKAFITGASSGLGREFARLLSEQGYDLILVARRKERLEEVKKELKTDVAIYAVDISSTFNCVKLFNKIKNEPIDLVINNAGFGVFGDFYETKLEDELDMIDLNIKAVHTLTKLFLKVFKERNRGYILNVASIASFFSGPQMASYYATKSYVLHLTEAIFEELRREESSVYIGSLCPGPMDTEFGKAANVSFSLKKYESSEVARYALLKMFERKRVIVPGFSFRCFLFLSRFVPYWLQLRILYTIQNKKTSQKM